MINIKIAGAVSHYLMFLINFKKIREFQKYFTISVYDGPNLCPWNGGRINRDITLTENMVKFYNSNNIGIYLTFSNPIIDLNDPIGNKLLEMLNHNPINGIVLVNEELRSFIKENYPEYQLIYSITGHPNDITLTEELLNHYRELELKYDVIVPRFEMVFNPDFYSNVNISKYELITNDTCVYGCSKWKDHFEEDARMNREYTNPWIEAPSLCYKTEECWIKNFNLDNGNEKDKIKYQDSLGMDFTVSAYKKAINLGYCNFKIMGRELSTKDLKGDIFKQLSSILTLVKV